MTHRRVVGAAMLAVTGLLLLPTVAGAHGLGSSDPNRPIPEYAWLGFKHLIAGWDHLLFILGVVLLAGQLLRATKLISLFVLGHSITLMLATTNEWTVSTEVVDVVITLSVLFVAVVGLRGRPRDWTWFGAVLFCVGLVHGLGLGTRLLELGVSDNDLVWRVLLFNIGVEFGQAAAVLGFFAIGWGLARIWASRATWKPRAFAAIAVAGGIGAAVLSLPDSSSGEDRIGRACVKTDVGPPPTNEAGHPKLLFYEPGQPTPKERFTHVMGDGYIVMTYRPNLPKTDVDALRRLTRTNPKIVIGGPQPGQAEPVIATTARTRLTCTDVDVRALTTYRDDWHAEVFENQG